MDRTQAENLFVRYRGPVFRFLRRLLNDSAAAEDLTQDVFVRALGAVYKPDDKERAWVFQIARNLARDHARRASYRGETRAATEEPAPFIDAATTIDVRTAILRLADEDRDVFLLREVAGLSYDEIAAACGLTTDAVRNRLYRSRLTLRETLTSTVVPLNRARI